MNAASLVQELRNCNDLRIVDDPEAAVEQFRLIAGDLGANAEERI